MHSGRAAVPGDREPRQERLDSTAPALPAPGSAPPQTPPRRGLRRLPQPGWGPRSTRSHFAPAGTRYQLRGVSLTHTVDPGASHIQGFLLFPHPELPVLGSLINGEKTPLQGKDPC